MSGQPKGRADLLIELGTEELPPKVLKQMGEQFATLLTDALIDTGLDCEGSMSWFATARRLAVRVPGVAHRCADQINERRGPALGAAFDDQGQPTPAATGFARSCGVTVDQLERLENDKGQWLVHRALVPGALARSLIEPCIHSAIEKLPIPKRMRWGEGLAEFVRPVHWLVVLHGQRVLPCEALGIAAGRISRGHRFMGEARISIRNAGDYEKTLKEQGAVIADFNTRSRLIEQQVSRLGIKAGGKTVIDPQLLDTVTALVEKPHALLGQFDPAFLKVPTEALISSMRDHQKYFHVIDTRGKLLPVFITVSNIRSTAPGRVRAGNERVLNARLADARFFWETDNRRPLDNRVDELDGVLFHQALGSLHDKTRRLETLSVKIAQTLRVDETLCARAAHLCKTDLVTGMVGEFPELQGTMGRYLAQHDKEPAAVARAIEEHYLPRHARDKLPASTPGRVLALADRIDSLVGLFLAGEEPTGDKDPYGLRRAALGVIRILIEKKVDLDIVELVNHSADTYAAAGNPVSANAKKQCIAFVMERYRALYAALGFAQDEISAVLEAGASRPLDFDRRLKALAKFRHHRDAASLAAANKRIRNILRKSEQSIAKELKPQLLIESAEIALSEAILETAGAIAPAIARADYPAALRILAGLRPVVDRFFDEVMVMVEDLPLRTNRLTLLGQLSSLFLTIADISLLQTPERPSGR